MVQHLTWEAGLVISHVGESPRDLRQDSLDCNGVFACLWLEVIRCSADGRVSQREQCSFLVHTNEDCSCQRCLTT